MNYKIFLLTFIITILSLCIFRLIIADTGSKFAYDYFLNKLEFNSTNNKVTITNNTEQDDKITNQNFIFKNIKGIKINKTINKNFITPSLEQLKEADTWIRSNGGNFSNKYSTHNNINKTNIKNLKLEFKINLDNKILKKKWLNNVETNPIFYEGILFIVTPYRELLAIDILKKKIKWKFKSLKKIGSRGMTLWINKENKTIHVYLFQ